MSWDDDAYGDLPRARRGRRSARQVALQVAGYVGLVAGVLALVVATVFGVRMLGVANTPGGFAAPSAQGRGAPPPPVSVAPDDAGAQQNADPSATDSSATGTEVAPLVRPESEQVPDARLVVDAGWLSSVSAATGIPERALSAYALAHVAIAADRPDCGIDWTTLAAIGSVESGHGSHGGAQFDERGVARPTILGPALDGDGVAAIRDTDGGALDGDTTWDRAVGPMQFIPPTWQQWGADADGDGVADPSQIDDAALTAARYLCASGPMTSAEGWRAAVFSYNHDSDYVDKVATIASGYVTAIG
ncbi:lytic transglycosylase domain-containing protein [Agromyces sp. SYSU T0242]|uniref:lytic transglycosylase domain-containing protein n=1 Tax=Agromyces litoreus TaxID=3158561 RepID=UPI0033943B7F